MHSTKNDLLNNFSTINPTKHNADKLLQIDKAHNSSGISTPKYQFQQFSPKGGKKKHQSKLSMYEN